MGTAETNGKLWGWRARDWAEIQEAQLRPVYDAVLAKLSLAPGLSLLDVGCGAGLFASMATERRLSVSAIDAAEALLAVARDRVKGADFRLGEIEQLPFADGAFDAVTGFNSFQYAAHPVAALAQAKRVAKSGAPVVVVTWGKAEGMPAAALVAALKPLMPPPPPGASGAVRALRRGSAAQARPGGRPYTGRGLRRGM